MRRATGYTTVVTTRLTEDLSCASVSCSISTARSSTPSTTTCWRGTGPAADLLLAACEQIDVEPGHAVLLADSPWDVAAAGRIGMQMIAVRTGGFGDSALTARGPATVVDAPIDVVGAL